MLIKSSLCLLGVFFIAHRQTQGGWVGELDLRRAEFPSDEQALYGHAVDRGADGFWRGIEPVVARD